MVTTPMDERAIDQERARPDAVAPPGLPAELERFKQVQRLAYACAEAIAASLEPGMTERQVAAAMRRWLLERGVDDWFHLPFVWFDERTAFSGFRSPHRFFPTDRRLERGMPYILDVAPVVGGATADIGYAGSLGRSRVQERLVADLADHRSLILCGVRAGKSFLEVYEDVDRLLARQGYENRHRAYPGSVLAHRVHLLSGPGRRWTVAGFGVRGARALLRDVIDGRREGWSPLWGPSRASDHAPAPGLWAVEPHLGLRGVGAKFEELLVITGSDAFWLDDDLPHVRRWREGT